MVAGTSFAGCREGSCAGWVGLAIGHQTLPDNGPKVERLGSGVNKKIFRQGYAWERGELFRLISHLVQDGDKQYRGPCWGQRQCSSGYGVFDEIHHYKLSAPPYRHVWFQRYIEQLELE